VAIDAVLAPVVVCMAVKRVPRDSVALTLAVEVSSTNASPAPLVAPSSDKVVVIAVSPEILWEDSLVNKVSRPVPVNEPANILAMAAALDDASARISTAKPSVTEVIDSALAVIVAAKPSVTEVIELALARIVAARPSVTEVMSVALAIIVAARASELVVIAAVVESLTVLPAASTAALLKSLASF